ncbi:unnamed protein product [Merluccius merluccius]
MESMTVEWSCLRGVEKSYLYIYHGKNWRSYMNGSYKPSLRSSDSSLKEGIVSLTLKKVQLGDTGEYRCFLPMLNSTKNECVITLNIGEFFQLMLMIDYLL